MEKRVEEGLVRGVIRWGSPIEQEVRRRISVSVAAYAYEVKDNPFMTDRQYDHLAELVNPRRGTCHPLLDEFFATKFSPMTGMWIHEHPEIAGIERIYARYHRKVLVPCNLKGA